MIIKLRDLIERILKEFDNNKPTGITKPAGTTTAQPTDNAKKPPEMDDDHWDDHGEPDEHDYKHYAPDI